MCFPGIAAVGSLVMGVAGSMAQMSAGQADYAAKLAQYNQNYQNSLAEGRAQDKSTTERQMQEGAAFTQKNQQALVEGAVKQSQVAAAAGSNGVAGNDVTALSDSVGLQIAQKSAALETNYKNNISQLQDQKQQQVIQEQMHIESVAQPIDPGPGAAIASMTGDVFKALGSTSGQAGLSAAGLSVM